MCVSSLIKLRTQNAPGGLGIPGQLIWVLRYLGTMGGNNHDYSVQAGLRD